MAQLAGIFREQLHIRPNLQTYEVLLGGVATAGDERKVVDVCAEVSSNGLHLSARGLSLMIKGFLRMV